MSTPKRSIRMVAAALAAGTLLSVTTVSAAAYPLPLTQQDINFLNASRGNFPGDDDTLLIVGRQMCRMLFTGQSSQAVIDSMAGQYGASPEGAAIVLGAARGNYCTSAPG